MVHLHLIFAIRWLVSTTCNLWLAIWLFLSETCYYLQKLVPFALCCTSRNFFFNQNLHEQKFGLTQIFLHPRFFLEAKFYWATNVSGPNYFLDEKIYGPTFFGAKIFLEQIWCGPNLFCTKHCFGPEKMSPQKNIISKMFHDKKFFITHTILKIWSIPTHF